MQETAPPAYVVTALMFPKSADYSLTARRLRSNYRIYVPAWADAMKIVAELVVIACAIGSFLCGCANAKFYRGADLSSAAKPTIIRGVPTVAQTDKYSCGHACLASVAIYYDVPFEMVEERILLGAEQERALSAGELVRAAESLGLVAFAYEGTFDDLQDNLQKNRPILALINAPPKVANYPAFEWAAETGAGLAAQPHWVVVVGLGPNAEVIIHDPNKGLLAMSKETFDKQWHKQSRMAVLAGKRL